MGKSSPAPPPAPIIPKPPAPPDPRKTSAAQTGTNISTTIANNVMGMVDQSGPYGSLTYNKTGDYNWTDEFTGEDYSVPTYEAITELTPEQQGLLARTLETQTNLGDIAVDRSDFLQKYLAEDPSAGFEELDDKLYDLGRQRIDPRMEARRKALSSQLANQGIAPGSEAYNREMELLNQSENDAYTQLMLQGRGQARSELTADRIQPINEIIGLLSGTQVQNPNYQAVQPGRIPITDNAGLINANFNQRFGNWQGANNANLGLYNSQLGLYGQQMQAHQNMMGGLFGLAGNVIAASDIRVKRDIKRIGERDGLGVYEFRYINDDVPRVGYMAQEVMEVKPEAVVDLGGVLHVDYAQLPEIYQ